MIMAERGSLTDKIKGPANWEGLALGWTEAGSLAAAMRPR